MKLKQVETTLGECDFLLKSNSFSWSYEATTFRQEHRDIEGGDGIEKTPKIYLNEKFTWKRESLMGACRFYNDERDEWVVLLNVSQTDRAFSCSSKSQAEKNYRIFSDYLEGKILRKIKSNKKWKYLLKLAHLRTRMTLRRLRSW